MLLTFLLAGYQIFQEVDGDLLVGGQVDGGVHREKVVHLALAPMDMVKKGSASVGRGTYLYFAANSLEETCSLLPTCTIGCA